MPEPEHILNVRKHPKHNSIAFMYFQNMKSYRCIVLCFQAGNGLLDSLRRTRENIGSLRLAQMRVNNDIRDKTHGMNTDSAALRLRRRKADHRWAMGAAF